MKKIEPMLAVADIGASLAYYRDVLGFEVTWDQPGEDGVVIHGAVKQGDASLMFAPAGLMGAPRETGGAGVTLYMGVDEGTDLDAYFAQVQAAGARIAQEPTDEFWGGRDFGVLDPDGYRLLFYAQTAAESAPATEGKELVGAPAD